MDSMKPAADATNGILVAGPSDRSQDAADSLYLSLSALMDDEASDLELRRLLRELPQRPDLVATWKRYHMVRAGMGRNVHANPAVDLLPGIIARLPADTTARAVRLPSSSLRFLGQGAIAASVAMAVLVAAGLLQTPPAGETPAAAQVAALADTVPATTGDFRPGQLVRSAVSDPEARQRLEQAVYQGLSDLSPPSEIPVSYNPDFPLPPRIPQ